MRVLDLFSGIGGFSLGLARAGFRTVAFCEIDPYARRVLAQHWPEVPVYDDIRSLTGEQLRADGISVDVVCAGWPCQDVSLAGRGAGLEGERSGLWREVARLIGEIRPSFAIMENSPGLLDRGLGDILGDLSSLGYDAEWSVVSACALGFPHMRERLWIVAYPEGEWREQRGRLQFTQGSDSARDIHQRFSQSSPARVVDGIPHRMDRLRCLGNAVVPQIPGLIGRAILAHEAAA